MEACIKGSNTDERLKVGSDEFMLDARKCVNVSKLMNGEVHVHCPETADRWRSGPLTLKPKPGILHTVRCELGADERRNVAPPGSKGGPPQFVTKKRVVPKYDELLDEVLDVM